MWPHHNCCLACRANPVDLDNVYQIGSQCHTELRFMGKALALEAPLSLHPQSYVSPSCRVNMDSHLDEQLKLVALSELIDPLLQGLI